MSMKLRRFLFKIPLGLVLLGLLFLLFIALAIVIELTKETSSFSAWVFSFVTNWSGVLSAVAALIMAIAAFATIRESRQSKSSNKIQTWADKTFKVLLNLPKEINGSKQGAEIIRELMLEFLPLSKDAVKLGLGDRFDSIGKELTRLNTALKDESSTMVELMEPYGLLLAHLMVLKAGE